MFALGLASPVSQAALAQAAGQASGYVWHNAVIGGGGYVPGIVMSQAERGLAYVRTDIGGAYRWDVRAGRWIPLQDGNAVSSYMGVESIAADPHDPDVVYLATGISSDQPAAIWRSADRGAHWRVVPVPFAMGGNEPGRGLGERLAIDPNRTSTLFFGSRHDGLWRSDDSGANWRKVSRFPVQGLGRPGRGETHGGIAFVLPDPASGSPGKGARRIWAGLADPGATHLFLSEDGGETWRGVAGAPSGLLAVRGAIDAAGTLYVAYADAIGPNGISAGALWRLDNRAAGRDITPQGLGSGGVMGLSVVPDRSGTVAVGTIDRWRPGDTVWFSRDGGAHWDDLDKHSRRDVSATPFLAVPGNEADFGHWISALAFDPFDPGVLTYATGATIYRTDTLASSGTISWRPWTQGIEETVVISLASPTAGVPVITGLGDISGFVHAELDRSPQPTFFNPALANTNTLDFAGQRPEVLVRSGSRLLHGENATIGLSVDGGRTWRPLRVPAIRTPDQAVGRRYDLEGEAAAVVGADGETVIACIPVPLIARDGGKTWAQAQGLDLGARPVADKVDPERFYSVDFEGNRILASRDGARTFAPVAGKGLPDGLGGGSIWWREQPYKLVASSVAAGHLWFQVGETLYHSTDGGESWAPSGGGLKVELFGLGRPAPGRDVAAVYATGELDGVRAIWRSLDGGRNWTRINSDDQQWGLRFRVISGDPKRFGRVYLGTDGRGLLYGDPVMAGQ
ncbi:carbohydrate-binding protein [Novosphingobium endophyticum]|uniref:Carbohydrate-binding protein n=1 Tax=Novosphingobium endophyticum TaxID=1955250 RepID=A0A916TV75_9SPHN|nr:hypothetical protein [Novosphingobium endophyticum]GGC02527.1 carbohydrate-binding protein [Novosphingobium endophyticum]